MSTLRSPSILILRSCPGGEHGRFPASPAALLAGGPLQEPEAGESGQTVDTTVDPPQGLVAIGTAEEVIGEELGFPGGHDAGADRMPQVPEGQPRGPLGAGVSRRSRR